MILNMLRPKWLNSKFSAYAVLEVTFNVDATPLAPLGTAITFHKKQNSLWGLTGTTDWHIGPALENYTFLNAT
eukprot:15360567-Ditylum_brightwellii.AAC.1